MTTKITKIDPFCPVHSQRASQAVTENVIRGTSYSPIYSPTSQVVTENVVTESAYHPVQSQIVTENIVSGQNYYPVVSQRATEIRAQNRLSNPAIISLDFPSSTEIVTRDVILNSNNVSKASNVVNEVLVQDPIRYTAPITTSNVVTEKVIQEPIRYTAPITTSNVVTEKVTQQPVQYTTSNVVTEKVIQEPIRYTAPITTSNVVTEKIIQEPIRYTAPITTSNVVTEKVIQEPVQYTVPATTNVITENIVNEQVNSGISIPRTTHIFTRDVDSGFNQRSLIGIQRASRASNVVKEQYATEQVTYVDTMQSNQDYNTHRTTTFTFDVPQREGYISAHRSQCTDLNCPVCGRTMF